MAMASRNSMLVVLLPAAVLMLFVSFSSLWVQSLVLLSWPISSYVHSNDARLDLIKSSTLLRPNPAAAETKGSSDKRTHRMVLEEPRVPSFAGVKIPETAVVEVSSESASCDLYHGRWFYDPTGPLYTNETCPIITKSQNCQGNGRPDKDYENYRWKPRDCELPWFDARKFLELMKGKTVAFVGDSLARNQMESLICLLWQFERPKYKGKSPVHKWIFPSTGTKIWRVWSAWLVHRHPGPFKSAPDGLEIVHLDIPDETFMNFLGEIDVLVVSSGHWFTRRTAYVMNGNVVGGQLWRPKGGEEMPINNVAAYGIALDTCLSAIAKSPNYKGLVVVRSYSPEHYRGGAWNTGGSCTGKTRPVDTVARFERTETMYKKQMISFNRAVNKSIGGARLRFMDITESFGYRADGHPGSYRGSGRSKNVTRGTDRAPSFQDCLHWCVPGPIDTWNELLLEVLRREYEGVAVGS